ncbi:MAG: hypothetical protein R2710_14165 [Acidimicrobiales bacterium]
MLDGNIQSMQGDYVGSTFHNLMGVGGLPPRHTTEAEIVEEDTEDESTVFRMRYSSAHEAVGLETRWERIGPDWKITAARPVEV